MTSKQQTKLHNYFQQTNHGCGSCVAGADAAQSHRAARGAQIGSKRNAVDDRKENVPPSPANSMGASKPLAGRSKGRASSRTSKQLFLDLGQKDFGASNCPVCGMVYAKGHEDDEKLHKSFHQNAVQGLKFQVLAEECVLLTDPFRGRLLMIMQSGPIAHLKRAREACNFIEKGYGITDGWLLSSPHCRVFLFVSLQKRIIGLAVVEPIKQAHRLAAADISQEADSSQSQRRQHLQQQTQEQSPPRKQPEQQQQRALQWPGLHRSISPGLPLTGPSSTSWMPGASCGTVAAAASNAAASDSAKADSCPPSLLAAAQHMQVHSAGAVSQLQGNLLGPSQGQQQRQLCSNGSHSSVCDEPFDQARQREVTCAHTGGGIFAAEQAALPHHQQQQQVLLAPPPPQQATAALLSAGHAGKSRTNARSGAGPGAVRSSLSLSSYSNIVGLRPAAAAASGAGGGSGGGRSSSRGLRSVGLSSASGSSSSCCLHVDKAKAVRAMLGVRMVWVSAEHRRKGLATKLLDAARCNMIPGYVVPRNQMAFTQPTDEGYKLAAQFTGTQQFLVYGIE